MTPTNETDESDLTPFGEWIDAHLSRKGWSVNDCAKVSGLAPSVIFRWRTGGYVPSIPNARTFGRAVGASVLDVLVASNQLSDQEIGPQNGSLSNWTSIELLRAVISRLEHASVRVTPNCSHFDKPASESADPSRINELIAALTSAGLFPTEQREPGERWENTHGTGSETNRTGDSTQDPTTEAHTR